MSWWTEAGPIWLVKRAAGVAAVTLLAACTTVGPNFAPPAPPAAAAYAAVGDASTPLVSLSPDRRAAGAWWRAMGSAQLDAVMEAALSGNPTVAQADAALQRLRAEGDVARAGRRLRVDANASAQRERIDIQVFGIRGFSDPTLSLYSVGASVSYGLDLFGGTRRRIERADALAEAQGWRADGAYLALTGNVALQAVRVAGLRDQAAILSDVVADDQRAIDIVRRAEAAGGEATSASLGGQAQLESDLALGPPVAQQLAEARHALTALVGQAPAAWTAPDFQLASFGPPSVVPVLFPSSLVRNRPDILAAAADLHADTASVGIATADLYPSLNLVAGLTQQALTPASIFSFGSTAYNFGPTATAPLFRGAALRAQRSAAEAQARASLARYQETVVGAFVQVSDALSALAQDDRRLAIAAAAETNARANVAAARAAYQLGGGAFAPIVTATRQLDRARLDGAEASGQRLEDVVSLYAATATDWGRPSANRRNTEAVAKRLAP